MSALVCGHSLFKVWKRRALMSNWGGHLYGRFPCSAARNPPVRSPPRWGLSERESGHCSKPIPFLPLPPSGYMHNAEIRAAPSEG